ncbi:hypothetical protein PW52_07365 [Tamlana sedimentorum]|uniref:C1q domain-containing protein n=1 Tax=Neotamlana sedimentorum TaxID=1435349 RepID=A0A0D7W8V0_9FLAO|nr:hypothetical protein [Tamlana sedimentorum]KJD35570.1 hypothetical protein PW52_07365 [Tamlana sedimentorum]
MKSKFVIILTIILYSKTLLAQVGIGTTTPMATLEINGDLKINTTTFETDEQVIRDSILVISQDGIVNRTKATNILNASLPTMVKASMSGGGNILHVILLGAPETIKYDTETIDNNNEFDTTTHTFTAKQDGIYAVNAQIKISSLISVSTNFGIGIYKNGVLIAEEEYLNVHTGAFSVSSPIRKVSTVIDLVTGDEITFKLSSSIASVDLLGNQTESFFTIYQLR